MAVAEGFNIFQHIGPNYLGGLMTNEARVAIHFIHRLGALLTFVYLSGLCVALVYVGEPRVTRLAVVIFALLLVQLSLGVGNVLFSIPLPLAVLHNAGAALLLLGLVTVGARIWMAKKPGNDVVDD